MLPCLSTRFLLNTPNSQPHLMTHCSLPLAFHNTSARQTFRHTVFSHLVTRFSNLMTHNFLTPYYLLANPHDALLPHTKLPACHSSLHTVYSLSLLITPYCVPAHSFFAYSPHLTTGVYSSLVPSSHLLIRPSAEPKTLITPQ